MLCVYLFEVSPLISQQLPSYVAPVVSLKRCPPMVSCGASF